MSIPDKIVKSERVKDSPSFLNNKKMSSKLLAKQKTFFLVRNKSVKKTEMLADLFLEEADKRGIKTSYDVQYARKPHELRYTEFFGALGGIFIGPACGKFLQFMLDREFRGRIKNLEYFIQGRPDKYVLHNYPIPRMDCSVILPGSNLLSKEFLDKRKLDAAVALGAKIKPHPLTNEATMKNAFKDYPKDRILPRHYSGWNVMMNSNYIFTTGASELSLLAILKNKYVIDISTNRPGGGYFDIFKRVAKCQNQKLALNLYYSHPGSGIIMDHGNDKANLQEINNYLNFYQTELKVWQDKFAEDVYSGKKKIQFKLIADV